MKRIITVQDISCVGKCSLTVALPIISAMGVEACVLPTAVLSTHTAFKGFTFRDLTSDIQPICDHWKNEKIHFDAIYTGYLGSFEQLDLMHKLIADFGGKDTLAIVDPCMADNGKLYPAFDMDYVKKNKELCGEADIIVPNITEAAFMTGMEYKEEYDESYIKDMLAALSDFGAKISVLTGVSLSEGKTGVYGYDSEKDDYFIYQNDRIDATYHGTGDLFSSTCIGEICRGKSWQDAMKIAADYTAKTISVTLENPEKPWYGVDFEATIPDLLKMA